MASKDRTREDCPKLPKRINDVLDPKPTMLVKFGNSQTGETQVSDKHSLRNVKHWVTDKMKFIGVQVRNIICESLDRHPDIENCLWENVHKHQKPEDVKIPEQWLEQMRSQVADLLVRNNGELNAGDMVRPQTGTYATSIRGRLLHGWAAVVGDPGEQAARWIFEGAPAGLSMDSSALDGMFPTVEDDADFDEISLMTNYETFTNYTGVEEDQEAYDALEGYLSKGFVSKYDTLEEVAKVLGCNPTLSKLGCIKKMKFNVDTGQYTFKARIILDCKRSGVSKMAKRTHKSVLPRVTDAVLSALDLMASRRPDQELQFFIADIVDAFWLIPLHVSERKFFCAFLRGHYYLFVRTAQGSRMAPLTFASTMSIASRWIQSLSDEYSMQVYVDDPLVVLASNPERTKRLVCMIAASWMIMGFPLAFHKATLAAKLVWIGVQLDITDKSVIAEVPEAKVAELTLVLKELLQSNLIPVRKLRSVTGKVTSIASVIQVWRPFVQQLYQAMHMEDTKAPKGCIWTKQVSHTIRWLLIFLQGERLGIRREFSLASYLRQGPTVVITWDASPYGMGATLQISGEFVSFFAVDITEYDQEVLQTKSGDCRGQQVWEALAGLVALRLWSVHWKHFPVFLQVRNDNMGALTLFATLKGGSQALSLLAREFALDLGLATCKPNLVQHKVILVANGPKLVTTGSIKFLLQLPKGKVLLPFMPLLPKLLCFEPPCFQNYCVLSLHVLSRSSKAIELTLSKPCFESYLTFTIHAPPMTFSKLLIFPE